MKKMLWMLLLSCLVISCHSTKKTIHQFGETLKESGFVSSDTGSKTKSDLSINAHTSTDVKKLEDSTYERTTEETVIEWIDNNPPINKDPADTSLPKGATGMWKRKETKRKITERGKTQKDLKASDYANTQAVNSSSDSSGHKNQTQLEQLQQTNTLDSSTKKIRVLPGWAWIAGIAIVLTGISYLTKNYWGLYLFGWKSKKNNQS